MTTYAVRDLTPADLADIATWAYDGPWSVYDSAGELDPSTGYWAVTEGARLVGFLCLGAEARVPGLAEAEDLLDVGVGMRPDLVGRGRGAGFAEAALDFAVRRAGRARALRVVVQSWNARSLRLVRGLGFTATGDHPVGAVTFVVLERPVDAAAGRSSAVSEPDSSPAAATV